jgi:hypothetical protein
MLSAGSLRASAGTLLAALVCALAGAPTRGTALASEGAGAPVPMPSPGDVVPAFVADGVQGSAEYVDFPKGSTTVLLFFLSGCPTCHKLIPEWNRAYERRPAGLKVIGVLMDQEPPGFFVATPLSFPVVRSPGRQFLKSLKVNRAPVTLRVGPGGRVEDVGIGLVDPIRLGELFRR